MAREPFLNARAAARFVGFEPGEGPARTDPQMRAFYAWVAAARIPKHYRGKRLLRFRESELEAAILANDRDDAEASEASLTRMEALAREHVLRFTARAR